MSEPKFTKGPWKNVKKQDYYNLGVTEHYYDVYQIINAKNEIVAKLTAEGMEKDIKANASLITAAPEMYDNEKSNMALLKVLREFIKTMMQESQFIPLLDSLTTFIDKIDERMVASEQILKKARGEE